MPPNRKISNWSPSAGPSSLLAAGSSRQILDLRSANNSSTLRCSIWRPSLARNSGNCSEVGTEVRRNLAPAAHDSREIQLYSRADQDSNSGSRCSTANVTGVSGAEGPSCSIPEPINVLSHSTNLVRSKSQLTSARVDICRWDGSGISEEVVERHTGDNNKPAPPRRSSLTEELPFGEQQSDQRHLWLGRAWAGPEEALFNFGSWNQLFSGVRTHHTSSDRRRQNEGEKGSLSSPGRR
jgi:hypothetical protein